MQIRKRRVHTHEHVLVFCERPSFQKRRGSVGSGGGGDQLAVFLPFLFSDLRKTEGEGVRKKRWNERKWALPPLLHSAHPHPVAAFVKTVGLSVSIQKRESRELIYEFHDEILHWLRAGRLRSRSKRWGSRWRWIDKYTRIKGRVWLCLERRFRLWIISKYCNLSLKDKMKDYSLKVFVKK